MKKQEIRKRSTFPIVESIKLAAAMIGAPQSALKAAKAKGCKAFLTGNRIDLGILIPFLFGMLEKGGPLPEGVASWTEALAREKTLRETIKRQVDEKSVMPIDEIIRSNGEAWSFVFSEMDRLCNELPPSLAGGTAVDIHVQLESFKEQMRKNAQQKFEQPQ